MIRQRMIRRMRKNLMRLGTIVREEVSHPPGTPRKDRAWTVEAVVNGYSICSPDTSPYGAYQGALLAAKWAMEQPFGNWVAIHRSGGWKRGVTYDCSYFVD